MYNDEFKIQYESIPIATYAATYRAEDIKKNIERLTHQHKELEILVVLKGCARMHIEEEEFFVREGDVVVISPYFMHRTTILQGVDFAHICICFDLSLLCDRELAMRLEGGEVSFSPSVITEKTLANRLALYAKRAFEAKEGKRRGWEFSAAGNISLFFAEACERGLISENTAIKNSFCHDVYAYIDKNFKENITSSTAADFFYVSNNYFCRKFKKYFGHCFTDYLCMHRIEKSKTLLKRDGVPISEAAIMSGFQSFSYYSKVFKKQTGVTPSEYRKQHRMP